MAELGGPWPLAEIEGIHRRRLEHIANGDWFLKIIAEPRAKAVGDVALWRSEWNGEPVSEAAWAVLPEHQGRGYATRALRMMLDLAQADGTWGAIHAFPGKTNGPSNALCRKFDFRLIEEVDVDYNGRTLRCNHWVLPSQRGQSQGASGKLRTAASARNRRSVSVASSSGRAVRGTEMTTNHGSALTAIAGVQERSAAMQPFSQAARPAADVIASPCSPKISRATPSASPAVVGARRTFTIARGSGSPAASYVHRTEL